MFCPECGDEYRDGFEKCGYCGVPLVHTLPDEEQAPPEEMAVLLKTPDVGKLAIVKSVLESADIPFLVQGEDAVSLFPTAYSSGFFNPEAHGAEVLVRKMDLDAAKELLESAEPDLEKLGRDP
jgi:hypothetical protein